MPTLKLLKSYTNPEIALQEINKLDKPLDFLITDVEMPSLSGLDLAFKVQKYVKNIVLVSGYQQYALDGYGVNAKDFLPKPFSLIKFESVVSRIIKNYSDEDMFIWIDLNKNSAVKLFINDIILIEGNGNYVNIHTINKIYIKYSTLFIMEVELRKYNQFKRVGKSYIVSTHHVRKKEGYTLSLSNDLVINIGVSYRKDFILKL